LASKIRDFFEYPKIFLVSLLRYLVKSKSLILFKRVYLDYFARYLLSFFNGLDYDIHISSDKDKLTFLKSSNLGLESYSINQIDTIINIEKNDSLIFAVLPKRKVFGYLYQEFFFLRIISFFKKDKQKISFIYDSIRLIKEKLKILKIKDKNSKSIKKPIFNKDLLGSIQYYNHHENNKVKIGYEGCFIIALKKNNNYKYQEPYKKSIPKRVIIFYVDNISQITFNFIKNNPLMFPNLSKLFLDDDYVNPINHLSISNWTLPAAVSMLSGKPYEDHKIFSPEQRRWLPVVNNIYNSALHQELLEIKSEIPTWFRCGTNWKMRQEYGITSLFEHCITNPEYSDCYGTLSNAFKQIDIAGENNSLHWIDIMDAHHPMNESILPNQKTIISKTIKNGLHYYTGPKVKSHDHKTSSKNIYESQLKIIDKIIGIILNYSFQFVEENDHLIAFVSDHGTSFMSEDNRYKTILEKHAPHIGFKRKNISMNLKEKFQKESFFPNDLFRYISSIYFNDETKNFSDKKLPYSQIMYPNSKYQFISTVDFDSFYVYTSQEKVQSSYHLKRSNNPILLENIFNIGLWEKVSHNDIIKVKVNELPKKIQFTFNEVKNKWINERYF